MCSVPMWKCTAALVLSLPTFAGYRSRNARTPVGEVESPTRFIRATPSGPVRQSESALA